MVYTAGCTDDDYADSKCPSKCDTGKFLHRQRRKALLTFFAPKSVTGLVTAIAMALPTSGPVVPTNMAILIIDKSFRSTTNSDAGVLNRTH
jgi:hypothetical protein